MNDHTMTTLLTRLDRDIEVTLLFRADTRDIDVVATCWRDTGESATLTDAEFGEVFANLHAIVYRAIRRKVTFSHQAPRRRVRRIRIDPTTLPF